MKNQSVTNAQPCRTENQFRTSRSSFAAFGTQLTSSFSAIFRHFLAFPGFSWHCRIIVPRHSCWNCWNSIAVMFELRCSKFELLCSESAAQPQDQRGRRFQILYDSVGCAGLQPSERTLNSILLRDLPESLEGQEIGPIIFGRPLWHRQAFAARSFAEIKPLRVKRKPFRLSFRVADYSTSSLRKSSAPGMTNSEAMRWKLLFESCTTRSNVVLPPVRS
jgi:hypothetical protein